MAVRNPWRALCLDRALWLFGSNLQNELEEVTNDAKDKRQGERRRAMVLARWFPDEQGNRRFKDPAAHF